MNRNIGSRHIIMFLKVFFILFLILVLLPIIVDQLMHFIGGGIVPGHDSIRVFRDLPAENEAIGRFVNILRILIIFM